MYRSVDAVALPPTVRTTSGPEAESGGTLTVMLVAVPAVTVANVVLKVTSSLVSVVSKFVPVIDTVPAGSTTAGENPVIVGAALPKVKTPVLVELPPGAVTVIVPVVAPVGTLVTICVVVD